MAAPLPSVGQAILSWAKDRSLWQQDALRRLATQDALTPDDDETLLAMLYATVHLPATKPAPIAKPLTASDLGDTPSRQPMSIIGIRDVQNVNRLIPGAGPEFAEHGLSVVYGPNGSGKTGFIRIFRTACRTRGDITKNTILGDVGNKVAGAKTAAIVIKSDLGETPHPWREGDPAIEALMRVAVFDRKAAELYVDEGNQIAFLPFCLAIPFELNRLLLRLDATVKADRSPTAAALQFATIPWPVSRKTAAQTFYASLKATTTDSEIDDETKWLDTDVLELEAARNALGNDASRAADLTALANWLDTTKASLNALSTAIDPQRVNAAKMMIQKARDARLAADTAANIGFAAEPLPQVGSEVWRRLWEAARDYSISAAYPSRVFPVTVPTDGTDPRCVLCQQPLSADGQTRLQRFEAFVSDRLNQEAIDAEADVRNWSASLLAMKGNHGRLEAERLAQIKVRDQTLAEEIGAIHAGLLSDVTNLIALLSADEVAVQMEKREFRFESIDAMLEVIRGEAQDHLSASDASTRADIQTKVDELTDRQILCHHRAQLKTRRDLLATDAKYAAALEQLQTGGVTRKANELLDTYLTRDVVNTFEEERTKLNISYLSVSLERKTDRSGASFTTKTNSRIKAKASDILSEGEQAALALAAFFTETSIVAPDAPIIIDDPVSSLDRERSGLVAARIVQAAKGRQVIVFTHDLVFLNDLSAKAEDGGIPISTCGIFRNTNGAGVLDPAGEPWKGKDVRKRINVLRQDLLRVKKLHQTSPSEYEREAKNIYSRLRDAWERAIEEVIFKGVVRRFSNEVKTRELRYVELSDDHADRVKSGMDKTSTHSHDNPAASNVPVPSPTEIEDDFVALETLIAEVEAKQKQTERRRQI